MGTQDKQQTEQSFRSSLEDVVLVAEALVPYCETVQDMVQMVKLALDSDGQLRMLMQLVFAKPNKR